MDPITLSVVAALGGRVVDSLLGDQANKLVSTLVGGVLGNVADRVVCEKVPAFLKNLRTTDPDLNHDLERGAREAYLAATLELVRQAEARANADPELSRLRTIRRGVEADLKNVANTLPKPLQDAELLLLTGPKASADRMQQLRTTLRANLDADVQRWLGAPPPPEIETLLEHGWTIDTSYQKKVARDWYSLIALAFVEKLKTDTRLRSVFEARLLAEIATREPGAAAMGSFAGFTAELEKITRAAGPD